MEKVDVVQVNDGLEKERAGLVNAERVQEVHDPEELPTTMTATTNETVLSLPQEVGCVDEVLPVSEVSTGSL